MDPVVSSLVHDALAAAVADGSLSVAEIPVAELERPRDRSHGDWSTNIAMKLAKEVGMAPRALAEIVVAHVPADEHIAAVEIAGPGFINFRLSDTAVLDALRAVHEQRGDFGRVDLGHGVRTQVEFVSANPVGPMHVGHGRWAALGDSLARLLAHAGYDVEREFYINDAGVQMEVFAQSVDARYMELAGHPIGFPENGYKGAYITEIAREIFEDEGTRYLDEPAAKREELFKERAYRQVLAHMQHVLESMGTTYDVWFSERVLHEAGPETPSAIEEGIARLAEAGYIYELDGATWFRTTDFEDDKDRVLKKADGSYTYFAADIAYHADKLDRGFRRIIDLWGADHHGYVKRMEAAVAALGHPGALDVVIGQLVTLYRDGEVVRMSKRTGEMVTFEELLDEVGPDAARYFFLRRSSDQPLDFDIGLATRNTNENPVYYVQYAHARICAILRKAAAGAADAEIGREQAAAAVVPDAPALARLVEPTELALARKLGELPEVVVAAAERVAPHKLTTYAEELAAAFHSFYTVCRVVDEDDPELTGARLYLIDATRIVLEVTLGLVGVSAPERM